MINLPFYHYSVNKHVYRISQKLFLSYLLFVLFIKIINIIFKWPQFQKFSFHTTMIFYFDF